MKVICKQLRKMRLYPGGEKQIGKAFFKLSSTLCIIKEQFGLLSLSLTSTISAKQTFLGIEKKATVMMMASQANNFLTQNCASVTGIHSELPDSKDIWRFLTLLYASLAVL